MDEGAGCALAIVPDPDAVLRLSIVFPFLSSCGFADLWVNFKIHATSFFVAPCEA